MNLSRREGPFVAEITGSLLSARRETGEAGWGSGGAEFHTDAASESLFILPVAYMPGFVMHGDGLYVQHAHDALAPVYRGGDAAQLLRCITGLLTDAELRGAKRRKFTDAGWTLAPYVLAGGLLILARAAASLITSPSPSPHGVQPPDGIYRPETAPARPSPVPSMPTPLASPGVGRTCVDPAAGCHASRRLGPAASRARSAAGKAAQRGVARAVHRAALGWPRAHRLRLRGPGLPELPAHGAPH